MGVGDSLFVESKELEQYRGFDIAEIFPAQLHNRRLTSLFTNGVTLRKGDVVGDSNPLHLQRVTDTRDDKGSLREGVGNYSRKE